MSGVLCSTKKKSSLSPAQTWVRRSLEKPPMALTPKRIAIASLTRKARVISDRGFEAIAFQASSGLTAVGRITDCVSL